MVFNVYAEQRLAAQKHQEMAAEIRRDRIGAELVRSSRPDTPTFWHRVTSLMPAPFVPSGRRETPGKSEPPAKVKTGDAVPTPS